MKIRPSSHTESDLIDSLRQQVANLPFSRGKLGRVRIGIGDDCAVLQPPRGHEILITTDFSLENVHFRRDWHPPESVGHRCLARGLSDLSAMGASPIAAFLSLALPAELVRSRSGVPSWRDKFLDGFLKLAKQWNAPLAGGDTAQSPELVSADVVLVGSAPRGQALLRSSAKPGDRIYVTGQLGGAAAELAMLSAKSRPTRPPRQSTDTTEANPHPHLYPEPRVAVGKWLVQHRRATSAIDISDGLSTDLHHLCQESCLAATIDASQLPMHPLAIRKNQQDALNLALHGGEDYELLFTASPKVRIPRKIAGVPVTYIGEMHRASSCNPRITLIGERSGRKWKEPLTPRGWKHYT